MTNYEKIKSMSIEEMAGFIEKNYKCERCVYNHNCYHNDCKTGISEWLKIGRELKTECKHLDLYEICRNYDCPAMGESCPCNEYPEICKYYESESNKE